MVDKGERAGVRKPRADAERNRVRLLATAKAVFAEKGAAASLDEIAKTAGVGPGTLYRHFPTRDALVAAVYRNENDQLAAAADSLAEREPPMPALREWLFLFVDYIATKHGMYELLNSLAGGPSELFSVSFTQLQQAIGKLTERAIASGDIHGDFEPLDLLRGIAGAANIGAGAEGEKAARRLVDILLAGLRPLVAGRLPYI